MNEKRDKEYQPMFNIKIELSDIEIRFEPEIGKIGDNKTVRMIIELIIDDFTKLAFHIKKQDTNNGDYMVEIKDNFEVRDNLAIINENLDILEFECQKYKNKFQHLQMLWTKDPQTTFQEFLENEVEEEEVVISEGGVIEPTESEKDMNNPLMKGVITRLPKFELFHKRINKLKKTKEEIEQFERTTNIGWLRVNANPLISSLS